MPSLVHTIATPEALRSGWLHATRRGSRFPGADGVTPAAFEADLARHLDHLARSLATGAYAPRPLRRFWLRRPNRSPRPIDVPGVRDRVVQATLLLALRPLIDPLLSEAAYAYRKGRSHGDAAHRLACLCAGGRPAVARGDVRAFFPSISHARLLALLDELLDDPPLSALLGRLLTVRPEDTRLPAGRGLPAGCALSPLLSNLFLLPFDRTIEATGHGLVRYGDDFAIAAPSDADARRALRVARGALDALGLRLNASKCRIHRFTDGVPFLGRTVAVSSLYRSPMNRPDDTSAPHAQASASRRPRVLYVHTQGATVSVEGERLFVRAPRSAGAGGDGAGALEDGSERLLARVGLPLVGHVVAFGTVHVTVGAVKGCLRAGIPVTYLTRRGHYVGRLAASAHTSAAVIRAQCAASADPERRLAVARALVAAKIRGHRALLARRGRRVTDSDARRDVARSARRLRALADDAGRSPSLEALRGTEGAAAAIAFGTFPALLDEAALAFGGRSRRPPRDEVNALLSFAYTLAHGQVEALVERHRLHPYVGFLHEDRPGHATLASDLLEPLRPVLDHAVLGWVRRGRFAPGDFERAKNGGCYLTEAARPRFLEAYERALRRPYRSRRDARQEAPRRSLWQRADLTVAQLAAALRAETAFDLAPLL